jgi:hypothetical protein
VRQIPSCALCLPTAWQPDGMLLGRRSGGKNRQGEAVMEIHPGQQQAVAAGDAITVSGGHQVILVCCQTEEPAEDQPPAKRSKPSPAPSGMKICIPPGCRMLCMQQQVDEFLPVWAQASRGSSNRSWPPRCRPLSRCRACRRPSPCWPTLASQSPTTGKRASDLGLHISCSTVDTHLWCFDAAAHLVCGSTTCSAAVGGCSTCSCPRTR